MDWNNIAQRGGKLWIAMCISEHLLLLLQLNENANYSSFFRQFFENLKSTFTDTVFIHISDRFSLYSCHIRIMLLSEAHSRCIHCVFLTHHGMTSVILLTNIVRLFNCINLMSPQLINCQTLCITKRKRFRSRMLRYNKCILFSQRPENSRIHAVYKLICNQLVL